MRAADERPTPKPPFAGVAPVARSEFAIEEITDMRHAPWAAQLEFAETGGQSYASMHPEKAAEMLDAIVHGVRVGFEGDRSLNRRAENLRSALKEQHVRDKVAQIIRDDVAAKKKAGPFAEPPPGLHVSPIGAVPKPPDGIRVIHHLSFPFGGESINAGIPHEDLELGRFDQACDAIMREGRGCSLTKLDVQAAYKQVPVHPDDRLLLGLKGTDSISLN